MKLMIMMMIIMMTMIIVIMMMMMIRETFKKYLHDCNLVGNGEGGKSSNWLCVKCVM